MTEPNADRILLLLKTHGPLTAAQLANTLRITAMGARQHLAKLAGQGLVDHVDQRLTVGRPKRHWRLTQAAHARFPDGHAQVTEALLAPMRHVYGEAGLARLIAARERDALRRYQSQVERARGTAARLRRLADLRSAEGYMAEVTTEPDGSLVLVENHCPIHAAATSCQGFCSSELAVFRKVMGD